MTDRGSDVDRAWSNSVLARLPARTAHALLDSAAERELAAGTIAYREPTPQAPHAILWLVVSGLLRVYVASPEGRELTIRYDREGAVLGLSSVVTGGSPGRLEAITRSRVLCMQVDVMRHLIKTDVAVANVVLDSLAASLFMIQGMLVGNVFGSVRTRVANHLIDLAVPAQDGHLIVRASQQDIADAIGSVREVVSRVLGALRDEGLISREADGINLIDVAGLHRVAHRPTAPSAGDG